MPAHRGKRGVHVFDSGMWIIYLEMALVFALAAFIVWWTLPSKRKPPRDAGDPDKREP